MMNIIDLFAGAGGLSEGFRQGNHFRFICHIEMDKAACLTLELRNIFYFLKKKGDLSPYYQYIRGEISRDQLLSFAPIKAMEKVLNQEISKETMHSIFAYIDNVLKGRSLDGVIGGPPCQAYSTIGRAGNKSKKSTDKRIYLYKHYIDFLIKYNPKFFVFENVRGLLSFKDMAGDLLFPKIIKEFERAGYDVDYKLLNASTYGVSQSRERLFIVGHRQDLSIGKGVFFKQLDTYKEEAPNLRQLFQDLPKVKSGELSSIYERHDLPNFIRTHYHDNVGQVLTQHSARVHNQNDLKIYKLVLKARNNGKNMKYDDLPSQLQTHSNKTAFLDRYKALNYDSLSHTVVAHIAKDGHYYIHPDIAQNRSITVREAARIQGFPDNYYFENSRTAAFKQIGNAVPPVLAKKIALSIVKMLR